MKQRTEFEKGCNVCEHAQPMHGTELSLCRYRGLTKPGYSCRRFRPDLLRIAPERRRLFTSDDLPETPIL